jgi:endonuclease G
MMTNRHVAEIFTSGLGQQQLKFKSGLNAAIDFKREIVPSEPQLITVVQILMIHPYWDMALLQVSGLPDQHPVLPLSVQHPEDLAEHEVALIGYPAQDFRNALDLQNRIFGGVYDVKRLQPGKLKSRRPIESFGHEVNTVTHDASTLGGNSGSAVINLDTGEVVALHFAGLYLDANFAVPTYELARDSRVVQAGVNFAGPVTPTDDWAPIWRLTDPAASEAAPGLSSSPSPAAAQTGNTATWTIPLQISVTLGGQRIDLAPMPGASLPAAATPALTAGRVDEGLFGGVDPRVLSDAYAKFAIKSFDDNDFRWEAALSAAACSHLAYDVDRSSAAQGPRRESCREARVTTPATRCRAYSVSA